MTLKDLQQLKESIENLKDFTPENLDVLVGRMFKLFEQLQEKIDSSSLMDQEQALQIAIDIKETLKKQSAAIRESAETPELENPANYC